MCLAKQIVCADMLTPLSVRTAQVSVQKYLAGFGKRYVRPDKATARERARTLKILLSSYGESKHRSRRSKHRQNYSYGTLVFSEQHEDLYTQDSCLVSEPGTQDLNPRNHDKASISIHSAPSLGEKGKDKSCTYDKNLTQNEEHVLATIDKGESEKITHYVGLVDRPRWRHKLSRLSLSSDISLYSSLLDKIDKLSSGGSSYVSSVDADTFDFGGRQETPGTVLARRKNFIEAATSNLIKRCCGQLVNGCPAICLHKAIAGLFPLFVSRADTVTALHAFERTANWQDEFGNNTLSYAARIGSSVDVMMFLIREIPMEVPAINIDGQNFMFFLNPQQFRAWNCLCQASGEPANHRSGFECLVQLLEAKNFDLDHLDHHGRHFLFYLCSFDCFDPYWLFDMMHSHSKWKMRMKWVANIRDSAGLFFIDFMKLNPMFDSIGTEYRLMCSPGSQQIIPTVWRGESPHNGRTQLHEAITGFHVWKTDSESSIFLLAARLDSIAKQDINRYCLGGRTPIMDFLERAVRVGLSDPAIKDGLEQLIQLGANVNARSRGGSTLLHFAAGKARLEIVKYLLSKDAQKDHRDDKGNTPFQYAYKLFKHSRKQEADPGDLISSFKSLMVLSERGPGQISDDDISTERLLSNGTLPLNSLHQISAMICEELASPTTHPAAEPQIKFDNHFIQHDADLSLTQQRFHRQFLSAETLHVTGIQNIKKLSFPRVKMPFLSANQQSVPDSFWMPYSQRGNR